MSKSFYAVLSAAILFTSPAAFPQTTATPVSELKTQTAVATAPASSDPVEDEMFTILREHYKMKPAQIKEYRRLVAERNRALDRIKFGQKTARSGGPTTEQVLTAFRAQVKELLNSRQYARWEEKKPQEYTVDAGLRKIFEEYWQELQVLNKGYTGEGPVCHAKMALADKYRDRMAEVVGEEKAQAKMRRFFVEKIAGYPGVKAVELDRPRSMKLASAIYDRNMGEQRFRCQNLSKGELRMKLDANRRRFEAAIAAQLTPQELRKWQTYQAGAKDRELQSVFRLTPEQVAAIRNIETEGRIQKTAIRNDQELTPAEKLVRMAEVTDACRKGVLSLVPAELHEAYITKYYPRKKAARMPGINPVPTADTAKVQ